MGLAVSRAKQLRLSGPLADERPTRPSSISWCRNICSVMGVADAVANTLALETLDTYAAGMRKILRKHRA